MKETTIFATPLGNMRLCLKDGTVTQLDFTDQPACGDENEAVRQINDYFAGRRAEFDLALAPEGTNFQRRVWQALTQIPYAETRTYGDIAAAVGNPKAARAVGMANNRNPIAIIIPCHRVIGANGKLVGYGGGLDKKAFLLELEKKNKG
ncbi:MAG: methylated-DNA--[protein]-cysteine S-methyltransferase [Oscillospiraceae bacterium]